MKTSKLILFLESLDKKELEEMEAFLMSPYFNKSQEVLLLFKYLSSFHPDIGKRIPVKKALIQALFPGQPYSDKQLRYLFSDLNRLGEQFLTMERFKENKLESDLLTLDELSKRDLKKAYNQLNRSLNKKIKESLLPQKDLLMHQFKYAEARQKHFDRSHVRKQDFTVQEMAQKLDKFYFFYRLYLSSAMLDQQNIFDQAYQIELSPNWISHLKEKTFFDEPIIKVYYTIFNALEEKEEQSHFELLKSQISAVKHTLHPEDLKDIYFFAINYCARKIRRGQSEYLSEALELNVKGVETGVLLENGKLSPWTFSNVVKLAIRLEKYQWLAKFIDDYEVLLMPDFHKNALHYNRAELYYATQKYAEAQQELLQVAFLDLNYYLGARVLLAKIYFEIQEEEALLSLLASFTIFLKRNKNISKDIKTACLNFCKILFQLIKKKPKQLLKLKKSMEDIKLLTERNWLEKHLDNFLASVSSNSI